jgi:hypothetical protein
MKDKNIRARHVSRKFSSRYLLDYYENEYLE